MILVSLHDAGVPFYNQACGSCGMPAAGHPWVDWCKEFVFTQKNYDACLVAAAEQAMRNANLGTRTL